MNFLGLVQRAHQESGLSGSGPTSVDNQVGMSLKLVNWVRQSWIDIQSIYTNWKFLRKKETRTLTVNKREYALVGDLNLPSVRAFDSTLLFITDPDSGQRARLTLLSYPEFEETYSQFFPGKPSAFTITPDGNVAFNAIPDKAYSVSFNYWMTGESLTEANDIPAIPEDYHMTIVWLAILYYAAHEGAPDVRQSAEKNYALALRHLEVNQLELPQRAQWRPLA